MLTCSVYSLSVVLWLGVVPPQRISSRRQLLKITALSAIFCFSVVCGNTSLSAESPAVYGALVPVVLGIVLASNSEPLFHLFGFLVCVGFTAGRVLKSVVQGILLTSEAEKLNSMNLLMYMAPMADPLPCLIPTPTPTPTPTTISMLPTTAFPVPGTWPASRFWWRKIQNPTPTQVASIANPGTVRLALAYSRLPAFPVPVGSSSGMACSSDSSVHRLPLVNYNVLALCMYLWLALFG